MVGLVRPLVCSQWKRKRKREEWKKDVFGATTHLMFAPFLEPAQAGQDKPP